MPFYSVYYLIKIPSTCTKFSFCRVLHELCPPLAVTFHTCSNFNCFNTLAFNCFSTPALVTKTVVPSHKTKLVELATQNAKTMVITHLVLVCINKNCEKEHKKSIVTFIVQKLTLMVEIWEVLSSRLSSLHTRPCIIHSTWCPCISWD